MKLWAAIWYDTDEYTYGCDVTLGIYSSRDKADEACLKHSQKLNQDLGYYHQEEIEVDKNWFEEE